MVLPAAAAAVVGILVWRSDTPSAMITGVRMDGTCTAVKVDAYAAR